MIFTLSCKQSKKDLCSCLGEYRQSGLRQKVTDAIAHTPHHTINLHHRNDERRESSGTKPTFDSAKPSSQTSEATGVSTAQKPPALLREGASKSVSWAGRLMQSHKLSQATLPTAQRSTPTIRKSLVVRLPGTPFPTQIIKTYRPYPPKR